MRDRVSERLLSARARCEQDEGLVGCEHDHGERKAELPDIPHVIEAIHARHHDISDEEVDTARRYRLQGFLPVAREQNRVPLLQMMAGQQLDGLVVLCDQASCQYRLLMLVMRPWAKAEYITILEHRYWRPYGLYAFALSG